MDIRQATKDDASAIANFQIEMARETEDKQLSRQVVLPAVESVFDDASKGFYLVAESDNRTAGSLLITYEWSDWRNSNMWWIQSVFVAKEFRGQGLFKGMYREVMTRAAAANAMCVRLYVEVENERAQQVYESLGMKRMPYFMYDVYVDNDG